MSWTRYAAPQLFYPLAGKMIPWFAALALLLTVVGLTLGLLVAPTDHRQRGSRTASSSCTYRPPGCGWSCTWPWPSGLRSG